MAGAHRFRRNDPVPALSRLLSESALWKAAIAACGVPIAVLDAATPLRAALYVNEAFERFFGYAPGEAVGRSLAQLVLRGDEPLGHRLLAEGHARQAMRTWGKDGAARHIELALGAVRNAEGRVTHFVAAFSDRSEVERLRAEIDSLRRMDAAA